MKKILRFLRRYFASNAIQTNFIGQYFVNHIYLPIFRQTTLPTTPIVWCHHVNHVSNHRFAVVEFAENVRLEFAKIRIRCINFKLKIVVTRHVKSLCRSVSFIQFGHINPITIYARLWWAVQIFQ